MDEREAIARCKRRDPSGLEVLVRLHQQQAVRLAALITRDRQSAEDAVAHSFLTAYERIHQFDDERPFGPWFRRIVANAALKAVSQHDRTVPLESLADQEGLDGDWLARLADPAPGPAESAFADHRSTTLYRETTYSSRFGIFELASLRQQLG